MDKKQCCGCRACEQICPKSCIKMIEDEEGYVYPTIDKEKCIKCGLCKKICPMLGSKPIENQNHKKYYRLVAKNDETIEKSSSGGAFTTLVKAILNNNLGKKYKIYGCTLGNDMIAKHISIDNYKLIDRFRKSKYVQSDLEQCYTQIRKELIEDEIVIFTGTPCQVAGLKKFLGNKTTENLYTIDLICHGVPSQKIFQSYIRELENNYNSKIVSFQFRERIKIGVRIDSLGVKVQFENDETLKQYSFQNLYMQGFFKGLYYRPCCETCPFSSTQRVSDFTIGDFWGIEKIHKELNPHKGISLCLVNSEKGKKIVKQLSNLVDLKEENLEIAIENNRNLSKPSEFSKDRKEFFKILQETNSFNQAVRPFVKKKSKLFFIISSNINKELKNKIKKVVKKK